MTQGHQFVMHLKIFQKVRRSSSCGGDDGFIKAVFLVQFFNIADKDFLISLEIVHFIIHVQDGQFNERIAYVYY